MWEATALPIEPVLLPLQPKVNDLFVKIGISQSFSIFSTFMIFSVYHGPVVHFLLQKFSMTYHVVGECSEDAEGDGVVGLLVHVEDGENGRGERADDELGFIIIKTYFTETD